MAPVQIRPIDLDAPMKIRVTARIGPGFDPGVSTWTRGRTAHDDADVVSSTGQARGARQGAPVGLPEGPKTTVAARKRRQPWAGLPPAFQGQRSRKVT